MPTKHNKNYGAVLLPLLVLWPALAAQAENEEVITRCAKIPSVGDRILCLEDALRGSTQAGETAIDADAIAKQNPTPDSAATAAAVAVAVGNADLAEAVTEEAEQSAPPDAVTAPPAEETMPATVAAVVVVDNADLAEEVTAEDGQSAPPDAAASVQAEEAIPAAADTVNATESLEAQQFGLSEVQKQPESLDSIKVVVVSVDSNAYGKLIFTTESGQVWRQTDQNRRRYRQIPFDAEIRKGSVGSFFLAPQSGGAAVRVKRSK